MFPALVIGTATSTQKHASLHGWKLLVVQPMSDGGEREGFPQLAIDSHDAGAGDWVLVCNEGKAARELVENNAAPIRWFVMGILDDEEKRRRSEAPAGGRKRNT